MAWSLIRSEISCVRPAYYAEQRGETEDRHEDATAQKGLEYRLGFRA